MLWIVVLALSLSPTAEAALSPQYYSQWFEEVGFLVTEAERTRENEITLLCFPSLAGRAGDDGTALDRSTPQIFDTEHRETSPWQLSLLDALTWTCSEFRLTRRLLRRCSNRKVLPWNELDNAEITLSTPTELQAQSTLAAAAAPTDWTPTFRADRTKLPQTIATLPGTIEVDSPGMRDGRMVIETRLRLEARILLRGRDQAIFTLYSEVLKDNTIEDRAQWQLMVTADDDQATLPIAFFRLAEPNANQLVVRLSDDETGRRFRSVTPIATAALESRLPMGYTGPAGYQTLGREGFDFVLLGNSVEILALDPGPKIHRLPVQAAARGPALAGIEWRLDDEPVAYSASEPYTAVLPLGRLPTPHRLEAIAVDRDGNVLARDRIDLNSGPHRLAIRLITPQAGVHYRGETSALARVDVPDDQHLERVDFFVDDEQIATHSRAPYESTLELDGDVAVVRAIATLADGRTAEDAVIVNAPDFTENIDVQWVELYVSVKDRRGRPVPDLDREVFKIRENGVAQTIQRFESIDSLPVHVLLAVDGSKSMEPRIDQARQVSAAFLSEVVNVKDRAALMSFNHFPTLFGTFSNEPSQLVNRVAQLTADGGTALYDSLVYGLFQFGGLHGKRALVVVSDGADEGSRFSADELVDYANRAGVAIYTISVGSSAVSTTISLRPSYGNRRYYQLLRRLADDTGGLSFRVSSDEDLDQALNEIREDLRSQYLLAYAVPPGDPDAFREIAVDVLRPGLKARSIHGYYPN